MQIIDQPVYNVNLILLKFINYFNKYLKRLCDVMRGDNFSSGIALQAMTKPLVGACMLFNWLFYNNGSNSNLSQCQEQTKALSNKSLIVI